VSGETKLTISGNLTANPTSGASRTGDPFAKFCVASTSRVFDRTEGRYRDGDTIFLDVTCWRRLAENVLSTLERGDAVVVTGRLRQRSYEDPQGARRTVVDLDADAVAADLGRCPARLVRSSKTPAADDRGPVAEQEPAYKAELTGETAEGIAA
jgi:single-strand DNA-binding protein